LLAKPRRYLTSATLVVIAVGLAGALLSALDSMQRAESLMMARAITAAAAMPASDIKELKGNNSDLENSAYQNIKRSLNRIRQENSGMQQAYLLGLRQDGNTFYYVNSEYEGSKNYTVPGFLYTAPTAELQAAFTQDRAFIDGPNFDGINGRVSAFAPVFDERTGKVVAQLGLDMRAYDYYQQIATSILIPLLLAAIPLAVLLRNRRLESKEQEVLQLKTQFVSVASHELRSPLSGALWGVQAVLKEDKLTKKQGETLTEVYNSVATSLASVNEILDFSIFDRGKANKLHRVDVNLVDIIDEVKKVLALSAEESGVKVQFNDKWPESAIVTGDIGALKRAFGNIMSNAIKYSHDGGTVDLIYEHKDDKHIIAVRDHGIGIPEDEQSRVVEGYYRATNASKKLAHGTGMGLWVTNLLIKQHKGRFWLESHVDHGTTVYVELPAKN
jgi:signal transduction histidine kinase